MMKNEDLRSSCHRLFGKEYRTRTPGGWVCRKESSQELRPDCNGLIRPSSPGSSLVTWVYFGTTQGNLFRFSVDKKICRPERHMRISLVFKLCKACAAVIIALHVYICTCTFIDQEERLTKAEGHHDCAYQGWQLGANTFGAKAKMHCFSPYTWKRRKKSALSSRCRPWQNVRKFGPST